MKNIALFVSFLDNEFSMDVMEGAVAAAKELEVNLFIIPTRLIISNYSEDEFNTYSYQYNTMLSYVEKGNFDGVVIETGVIFNGVPDEDVKYMFDSFGIPVVSIARKIEGYPNIRFNCNGLREELQHLIDHHNCKHIAFIGGPTDNLEAIERLELYKETLADNGIKFDKKLYGMGNFSEFCEDEVRKVLEKNKGNIDAICFANDRMAIGGYKVIEKMGLVPGKDILVIGFDDAPSACAMNPPLTTVHSNIPLLGRSAIKQCLSMINGKDGVDTYIDTNTVIRSSCGCPSRTKVITDKISASGSIENIPIETLCADIRSFLFDSLNSNDASKVKINEVVDTFYGLLTDISTPEFDSEDYVNALYTAITNLDFEVISYSELSFVLNLVRKKAELIAYNKEQLGSFFFDLMDMIASGEFNRVYTLNQEYRILSQTTSSIVYDVLANINNEATSYQFIITNVRRHKTDNCLLFIHDLPVICNSYKTWQRPRKERLVCYQDGHVDVIPTHDMQEYSSDSIFRCGRMIDKPHVFVASPLFYNNEHYGILFVEKESIEYAYFEWVIFKQVSYALKMKRLMEEQMSVQTQLSKNMELIESYNQLLREKSVSDELTGIYNRRGFMERVTDQITNPDNLGKRAVILYADLNYLKLVNDRFGHDEGDYAIKAIATILKSCFRESDIVARFGGDEFAAFGFIRGKKFESILRARIKEVTDEFNENSEKPFLVTASIGIYEFKCDEFTNLTECMNKADAQLYEDKKNKPKTVIR